MTSGFDYSVYQTDASAKESYRIKDGLGGKSIFNEELIKDVPRYKEVIGKHLMDIVMYPAGANHPMVVAKRIQQGTPVHITWAFIHKKIGPGQDWIICLAKTYGARCPICEYANTIRANANLTDEEVKAAISPYWTGKYPLGIYNCVHHANPNQITWSEPVMMWDINNSFMESKLQAQAKQAMVTAEAPTGYINYQWPTAGPQGGRHIEYETIQKGQYFDYIGHKFYQRQQPIPEHVMRAAICLDDFLVVPTFEEVKESLEADIEMKASGGGPASGQPSGDGVYAGQGYGAPGFQDAPGQLSVPQVFGTPSPQCPYSAYEGVYGQTFNKFEECNSCTFRFDCEKLSNPLIPESAAPQPTAAPTIAPTPKPTPAAPIPGPGQAPAPAAATPPPGAPIPRRPNK